MSGEEQAANKRQNVLFHGCYLSCFWNAVRGMRSISSNARQRRGWSRPFYAMLVTASGAPRRVSGAFLRSATRRSPTRSMFDGSRVN